MIGVVTIRQDSRVLIVRATTKLLDRIGPPTLRDGEQSTTLLGQWYGTPDSHAKLVFTIGI